MKNDLQQIVEKTWSMLDKAIKGIGRSADFMYVDSSAKEAFEDRFNNLYNHILNDYMKDTVEALDRHKVASIITVALIEADVIKFIGEIPSEKKFFGNYLVAASIGISYMQDRLNKKLIEKGENPIGKLWMPPYALSCDTPYFEIMCRNLYYSNNEFGWGLNPLEMADKLFILEYITLEKNGINPLILKEDNQGIK